MVEGTVVELVICLISIVGYLVFYKRATGGDVPHIRRIAGLDVIDEAIGRCTEQGKPVHYTFGRGEFDAGTLASFDVLSYTARKCAETSTDIITSTARPDVHSITEEIISSAYRAAERPDDYKPDNIRFFSDLVPAYVAGIYGIFDREKPGANIMLGNVYGESIMLGEAGNVLGAIQIGGASQVIQIPFLVATCDYTLLGDELFAAGAYITKEPDKVAAVVIQDLIKWSVIGATLVGTLLTTVGSDLITRILNY